MSTIALRKWRALFGIYFQETLAYRASMLIWILTDITTSITMPLVFVTASAVQKGPIEGYTAGDFVLYYLSNLLIVMFVTSHIMWDLSTEIREGQFTSYLMRPFGVFQTTMIRNVAWRILRTVWCAPIFLTFLFVFRGYLEGAQVNLGWEFWVALILGHFVSFCTVYALAMIALMVQEAYSIFELYYVPMLFFSGQLFPISMLPGWAQSLAHAFPFYYTAGFPTEVLVGRVPPGQIVPRMLIQVAWIVVALVGGKLLWEKGRKMYTAVGM